MYTLARPWDEGSLNARVALVGCGGTGGFVAEGLCRMLAPQVEVVLVDHDRVEERNLLRQNFHPGEVGRYKAQALAERLARQYRRPVAWSVTPLGGFFAAYGRPAHYRAPLLIGCVDNALARQGIQDLVHGDRWWVDAGNGENWGQVLIGNRRPGDMPGSFGEESRVCVGLPLPTVQHPELLSPPPAEEAQPLSCAELLDTGDQDPTVNQAMAALVLQVVRRVIRGDCPWMALYLDLGAGTLNPVPATPEAAARASGIRKSRLVVKG